MAVRLEVLIRMKFADDFASGKIDGNMAIKVKVAL